MEVDRWVSTEQRPEKSGKYPCRVETFGEGTVIQTVEEIEYNVGLNNWGVGEWSVVIEWQDSNGNSRG